MLSAQPPHSSTRVNSQTRPSETANVERSCPTETATSAPRSEPVARVVRRGDGAQQRERLQVDPDDLEPGLAAGVDVAVDELAIGDDEEHAPERLSVLGDALGEHLVVEDGLLERDRQHLLRPEADRIRELLRVLDPRHLEGADADPVVGDAEPDAALGQLVLGEEGLERDRQCLGVAQLAVDDDAVVERGASRLDELDGLAVANPGGRDLGAADLETDELLATATTARQRRQGRQGRARPRQRHTLLGRLLGEPLARIPLLRAALEREVALVERHLAAVLRRCLLLLRALLLRLLRLLRLLGRLLCPRRQLELLLVEGDLGGRLGLSLQFGLELERRAPAAQARARRPPAAARAARRSGGRAQDRARARRSSRALGAGAIGRTTGSTTSGTSDTGKTTSAGGSETSSSGWVSQSCSTAGAGGATGEGSTATGSAGTAGARARDRSVEVGLVRRPVRPARRRAPLRRRPCSPAPHVLVVLLAKRNLLLPDRGGLLAVGHVSPPRS